MKKLVLLSLVLFSCQKEELTKRNLLGSRVKFTAEYVNKSDCDSMTIVVKGIDSFTFATHKNPCFNKSYGFSTLSKDEVEYIPYVVLGDRDTLVKGYLEFSIIGGSIDI